MDAASRITAKGPVTLGVVPENLLMDGAAPPRPDQAVRETAALLHDHMIGLLTLHSSPDPDGWLPFLNILGKSFDEVRAAGGIGRLWGATGQRHLELQEIDYADILRERAGDQESQWDAIIRACQDLDSPLTEEALRELLEVCGNAERFSEFVLDARTQRRHEHGLEGVRPAPHAAGRRRPRLAHRPVQDRDDSEEHRAGIRRAVAGSDA